MVANLNRLPVKRVHQAKRYEAKRNAQYGAIPVAPPANVMAVAAPPPAPAPAPAAPPPAPPAAPPPVHAPAPPPAPPPAAPPAVPATTTAPLTTASPLVSAPIQIKPVSAVSSAKTAASSIGGAPSPVPSATRLSVKPLTTTSKPKSSAVPTTTSLSPGHTAGSNIASNGKGLSGGGIAGIIIGVIIFMLAVILFVKRKRAIMMRKGKRNWERDLFPKQDDVNEKSAADISAGQYAFQGHNNTPFVPPLTPLSASYNNPTYFAPPTPSTATGGQIISTFNSADLSSKPTAIIRCTFIPSLPDELSITTGEIVTIVNEYDDGWALCANVRGEQGMVPLECLQKDAATPTAHESDWKNAQRASSLIFRDGERY